MNLLLKKKLIAYLCSLGINSYGMIIFIYNLTDMVDAQGAFYLLLGGLALFTSIVVGCYLFYVSISDYIIMGKKVSFHIWFSVLIALASAVSAAYYVSY